MFDGDGVFVDRLMGYRSENIVYVNSSTVTIKFTDNYEKFRNVYSWFVEWTGRLLTLAL